MFLLRSTSVVRMQCLAPICIVLASKMSLYRVSFILRDYCSCQTCAMVPLQHVLTAMLSKPCWFVHQSATHLALCDDQQLKKTLWEGKQNLAALASGSLKAHPLFQSVFMSCQTSHNAMT